MVSRSRRLLDLLQVIDLEPNFNKHPDEVSHATMANRVLRKEEIQRVCEILDLDDFGRVPELRDRIREEYFSGFRYGTWRHPKDGKKGTSEFSTGELRKLNSLCRKAQRMTPREVPQIEYGDILEIITCDDKFEVDVIDEERGTWRPHWGEKAYDSYDLYELSCPRWDRNKRLMVLHDLNTDVCRYDNAVLIEKPRGYGPYKHWKKDEYVWDIS